MSRVLLTGPSGFLGTHCLELLQTAGCGELHAVNRTGAPQLPHHATGVHWHAADLSDQAAAVAVVEKIRPTHILHAAWIATPGVYAHAPENLAWLQASIALVQAFARCGGQRFVGVGTSAEYDPGTELCVEDETRLRPASVYGKAKLSFSIALEAAAQSAGFSAAWARVFLPYGPGDPPQRLIPSVVAALRARRPIALSSCEQVRDFIYAPDAAAVLVALLWSNESGAFNVGSGEGVTIRSALERLAGQVGEVECLQFGQLPLRPGEPMMLAADMTKVRARLGWQAPTLLDDGLRVCGRAGKA
jgi:nucleoside-diphosphate-sugar epimerase